VVGHATKQMMHSAPSCDIFDLGFIIFGCCTHCRATSVYYICGDKLMMLAAQYAEQGLCNGPFHLSVCLSRRSTAAMAAGGFAAECSAGTKYRSTGVDTMLQVPALSSICG